METHIFKVPPGSFSNTDTTDKEGKLKPIPGLHLLHDGSTQPQYDATDILKKWGVSFPPGSMAIYEMDSEVLVVRNTSANINLVEQCVGNGFAAVHPVEIELSVVECIFPQNSDPLSPNWPGRDEVAQLPPKSKKLLDRVTVIGAPGQRLVMSHVTNPASGHKADSITFAPGEAGTIVEIEPVEGEKAFDVNIAFQFRQPGEAQNNQTASDIDFTTSFEAWNDDPTVIHISSVPGRDGKFICVIARLRRVNAGGWKVNADGKPTGDAVSSPRQ